MNAPVDAALIEKLKALPPERRAKVADFIDFLTARERGDAFDAFLEVAERVAQAGVPALTPEEVDAEIQALRAGRRARND
jgi:hypothetical protein